MVLHLIQLVLALLLTTEPCLQPGCIAITPITAPPPTNADQLTETLGAAAPVNATPKPDDLLASPPNIVPGDPATVPYTVENAAVAYWIDVDPRRESAWVYWRASGVAYWCVDRIRSEGVHVVNCGAGFGFENATQQRDFFIRVPPGPPSDGNARPAEGDMYRVYLYPFTNEGGIAPTPLVLLPTNPLPPRFQVFAPLMGYHQ